MTSPIRYQRPHIGRVVLAVSYLLATTGLLVLAFDSINISRASIVVAAAVTIAAELALLVTGYGWLYLGIGAVWIYATVVEAVRGLSYDERYGLGLIFLALAFGALAAYTAYRRELPLRT